MVLAEGPEEPLAGLGVIVGHAEHVAWGAESIGEPQPPGPGPALLQVVHAYNIYKLSSSSYCCKSYLLH